MLRISSASASQYCDGYSRRSFVQLGATGLFSAGLPGLLAARAAQPAQARQTSVILLWLDGGPGHMDTYDMKPDQPIEVRDAGLDRRASDVP